MVSAYVNFLNLIYFHFNISKKLSVIRCYTWFYSLANPADIYRFRSPYCRISFYFSVTDDLFSQEDDFYLKDDFYLGTCFPAPVSEKKVLKLSSPDPADLSLGIWPSGWIPGEKNTVKILFPFQLNWVAFHWQTIQMSITTYIAIIQHFLKEGGPRGVLIILQIQNI